ncbi:Hypothetical predicted protein, partial [Pelobates cultripes]
IPHIVSDPGPQWVTLERDLLGNHELPHLLWTPPRARPTLLLLPTQLLLLFQIWHKYRPRLGSTPSLSLVTPLGAMPYIIPTFNSAPWHLRRVTHLYHLFAADKLLDFPSLREKFALPHSSLYSYLQLKSYLYKEATRHPDTLRVTNRITEWEQMCLSAKLLPHCKPISMCLSSMTSYNHFSTTKYARQWESDLNCPGPLKAWDTIFTNPLKLLKSSALIEQHHKILYRWYLVPTRLHKIFPSTSSQCWRCHTQEGSMYHIWWSCPRLLNYWNEVHDLIQDITQHPLEFTPLTCLVLDLPRVLPQHVKKMMLHIVLTAQQLIARRWKSTLLPNKETLIEVLHKQWIYETSYKSLFPPSVLYRKTWELWQTWRS